MQFLPLGHGKLKGDIAPSRPHINLPLFTPYNKFYFESALVIKTMHRILVNFADLQNVFDPSSFDRDQQQGIYIVTMEPTVTSKSNNGDLSFFL